MLMGSRAQEFTTRVSVHDNIRHLKFSSKGVIVAIVSTFFLWVSFFSQWLLVRCHTWQKLRWRTLCTSWSCGDARKTTGTVGVPFGSPITRSRRRMSTIRSDQTPPLWKTLERRSAIARGPFLARCWLSYYSWSTLSSSFSHSESQPTCSKPESKSYPYLATATPTNLKTWCSIWWLTTTSSGPHWSKSGTTRGWRWPKKRSIIRIPSTKKTTWDNKWSKRWLNLSAPSWLSR